MRIIHLVLSELIFWLNEILPFEIRRNETFPLLINLSRGGFPQFLIFLILRINIQHNKNYNNKILSSTKRIPKEIRDIKDIIEIKNINKEILKTFTKKLKL